MRGTTRDSDHLGVIAQSGAKAALTMAADAVVLVTQRRSNEALYRELKDSVGIDAMRGEGITGFYRIACNEPCQAELATGTRTQTGWEFTSKMDMGGQTIHSRFVMTDKSPTVHTVKWDVSMDGKTWKTIMEGTSTKTGS